METKAHYTLIGAFVIALLVSLFVFLIWLAKFDIDQEYNTYDVYFKESVFGLNKASPVTYNGIPVGEVREINIARNDPGKVQVRIRVKAETPVMEDTVATLGMQGITGVLFVQIVGGQPGSPPLKKKAGEDYPVIQSRPSTLEEFFGGGGDLINQAMQTFEHLNQLLSAENVERLSQTFDHIESLSGDLAEEGDTVQETLKSLRDTVKTAESLFSQDLKPAAHEFRELSAKANSLVGRLDNLIATSEGDITGFTGTALPEMELLIGDLRRLSQSLTKLSERLEEQPSEVVFKRAEPEYEVEK